MNIFTKKFIVTSIWLLQIVVCIGQGVGINTSTPKSMLDVEGNAAVGATYSGTTAAPDDGMIVEGDVGIGTSAPLDKLNVVGNARYHIAADAGAANRGIIITPNVFNGAGSIKSWLNTGTFDIGAVNTGTSNTSTYIRLTSNNTATVGNTAIAFHTSINGLAGTEYMRINGDGKVGIGTSAPDKSLTVAGTMKTLNTIPALFFEESDAAADNKIWYFYANNENFTIQGLSDAQAGGGNLIQITRTNNQLDGLDFKAAGVLKNHIATSGISYFTSGNVGIGTNVPQAILNTSMASGGSSTEGTLLRLTKSDGYANDGTGGGSIVWSNAANDSEFGKIRLTGTGVTKNSFDFIVANGALNPTDVAMRIRHDGLVSIGTTTPNGLLHLEQDGGSLILKTTTTNDAGRFKIRWENNTSAVLAGDGSGNQNFSFFADFNGTRANNAELRVYGSEAAGFTKYLSLTHDGTDATIGTASGDLILSPNTGLVGIGRTPTTNALEVNGTASKTAAGDWVANSDARLKKDITPLDSQQILETILKMRGVNYFWNDTVTQFGESRPTELQYGFIAQEVQKILPDFVSEDKEGYLQMAYGTFDPLIIEAIKAQQKMIDEMKLNYEQRINELEEQLKLLSNDINSATLKAQTQ